MLYFIQFLVSLNFLYSASSINTLLESSHQDILEIQAAYNEPFSYLYSTYGSSINYENLEFYVAKTRKSVHGRYSYPDLVEFKEIQSIKELESIVNGLFNLSGASKLVNSMTHFWIYNDKYRVASVHDRNSFGACDSILVKELATSKVLFAGRCWSE